MRKEVKRIVTDTALFKKKVLHWSQQFNDCIFLDSNNYPLLYSSFNTIIAVDAFTSIQTDYANAFEKLSQYQKVTKDWIFGYLSYDLKNDIEDITSNNEDKLAFSDLYFFQPKKIFIINETSVTQSYLHLCEEEINDDWQEINEIVISENKTNFSIKIKQKIAKEHYFKKIEKMKQYIQRGDIYEANFCMEFYAENVSLDSVALFENLNDISSPPFACYIKHFNKYLCCASPERYLRKEGLKIISQPIKGTSKRAYNLNEDNKLKKDLIENQKERSENVMIVDLVRNDLSKTAIKGSVKVEELCEVYTFKQVHQLISTIVSYIDENTTPVEVIKTTFPMGSMTGAPKIAAMKIIEELEETKRGLFSGAVGYFTPQDDFDFNVVIRSILYNKDNKYLSFSVGSAITSNAEPEKEYDECMLKAKAMFTILNAFS